MDSTIIEDIMGRSLRDSTNYVVHNGQELEGLDHFTVHNGQELDELGLLHCTLCTSLALSREVLYYYIGLRAIV